LLTGTLCFLAAIFAFGTERQLRFADLMAALFGALAIPASFACLSLLRQTSAALTLTPFVAAFCSDSLALFAGMAFGKHKLAPHVSPKKTVEGSVGGFLGAVLGMLVFNLVIRALGQAALPLPEILLMGLLGSFMGQLGDLSFSVVKREFGVKDYGNLIPGHGGVLDRFDSVTFVTPFVYLTLKLI
jgi:phosphatidate cytidylyltransferase